jgi:hypothetical protein
VLLFIGIVEGSLKAAHDILGQVPGRAGLRKRIQLLAESPSSPRKQAAHHAQEYDEVPYVIGTVSPSVAHREKYRQPGRQQLLAIVRVRSRSKAGAKKEGSGRLGARAALHMPAAKIARVNWVAGANGDGSAVCVACLAVPGHVKVAAVGLARPSFAGPQCRRVARTTCAPAHGSNRWG